MEFKLGGGKHLQPYDSENGQYADKEILDKGDKDMENLVLVYIFGLDYGHLTFHFPNYKIHDKDYCDLFVKYTRRYIRNEDVVIEDKKAIYFLTWQYGNDKSEFFIGLGYSISNLQKFIYDIRSGTAFEKSEFSRICDKCFSFKTQTTLKGYIITSIWQIHADGTVRLVTLIPGGDKIWK